MNVCILSGRIWKNPTVKGTEPKTLSFLLETKTGLNGADKKERTNFVPCVLFNPDPELEGLLTSQGEGLLVELEGRLSGSAPDASGGRRFNTEVIVRNKSLTIRETAPVAT